MLYWNIFYQIAFIVDNGIKLWNYLYSTNLFSEQTLYSLNLIRAESVQCVHVKVTKSKRILNYVNVYVFQF